MRKLTAEEKLLRLLAQQTISDPSRPVRQEVPICPRCRMKIDIMNPDIRVDFPGYRAGDRPVVVAEPTCPNCNTAIPPKTYVNH